LEGERGEKESGPFIILAKKEKRRRIHSRPAKKEGRERVGGRRSLYN